MLLPIGNRPAFRTAWLALQRIGAIVVPAYLAHAQARAREFTAAFWHSRDVGSVDADGFVRIVDRTKDMLNRGGSTPDSAEVDNVPMAWPGVVEATIVGQHCPVLGERVHAFVHAPGTESVDDALRRHGAERRAGYQVPESITWSARTLPRNANRKLLKKGAAGPCGGGGH